jgi:hypothetical protein
MKHFDDGDRKKTNEHTTDAPSATIASAMGKTSSSSGSSSSRGMSSRSGSLSSSVL